VGEIMDNLSAMPWFLPVIEEIIVLKLKRIGAKINEIGHDQL